MRLWTVPSSLLLKVDEINLGVHTEGTGRGELGLGVCDEVGWAGSLAHSHTGGRRGRLLLHLGEMEGPEVTTYGAESWVIRVLGSKVSFSFSVCLSVPVSF